MTDKRSESQFTAEESQIDSARARHNGFFYGFGGGRVSSLEKRAKKGDYTPISGTELAKSAAYDKDRTITRGGGIIQSGKLVKGGNETLAENLERGKK